MALVDHVKEHVSVVSAVREIADFVDDEDGRVRVGRRAFASSPARDAAGRSSMSAAALVDKHRNRSESPGGPRRRRDPFCRVPACPPGSASDFLRDDIWRERRDQHLQPQRRLVREIESVDGSERESARGCQSCEARLLAVRDLLRREQRQEVTIRPPLSFRPVDQPAPDPAGIREVHSLEPIEIGIGGHHDRHPTRREMAQSSSASRGSATSVAPGRLRRSGPACVRPRRGRDVEGRSSFKGERHRNVEILCSVPGLLFGDTAFEGGAQRRIPVRLHERSACNRSTSGSTCADADASAR